LNLTEAVAAVDKIFTTQSGKPGTH